MAWTLNAVCSHFLGFSSDVNTQHGRVQPYPEGGHAELGSTKGAKEQKEGLHLQTESCKDKCTTGFQMPLHYPRYSKANYEKMEEWKLDMLLKEYGLRPRGTLDEKRAFAIGTFLWPGQM